MRILTLVSVLFISFQFSNAFNPSVEWVAQIGGSGYENLNSIAIDNEGNIYSTGSFKGTIVMKDTIVLANWDSDIFICKHDSEGNFLWIKTFESQGDDVGWDIKVDKEGKIYFTGWYQGSVMIDGNEYISNGDLDILILKLEPNGNIIWVKSLGSEFYDTLYSLDFDSEENLVLTGEFMDTIDLGNGKTHTARTGSTDMLLVKYSPDGDYINSMTISGYKQQRGSHIGIDKSDNMFIAGFFSGSIYDNKDSIPSRGGADGFIAYIDKDFKLKWLKTIGCENSDYTRDLLIEGDCCYVTGYFTGDLYENNNFLFSSYFQHTNSYILKYDNKGNLINSKNFKSRKTYLSSSLNWYAGNLLLSGRFSGFIDCGGDSVESKGLSDAHCTVFDDNYKVIGTFTVGGKRSDYPIKTRIFNTYDIIMSGSFEDTVYFQPDVPTVAIESQDAFIIKLKECNESSFNYPALITQERFTKNGDAGFTEKSMVLNEAKTWSSGAVWYENKVSVGNGFTADFSFRISEGYNNQNYDDGSLPGADGLAFVIQNTSPEALGKSGYGIGYDGIPNALVIEFDTYNNNSSAYDDLNDPDGNHIGIFASKEEPISCDHSGSSNIATLGGILPIKTDSSVYYARVDYNKYSNELKIYCDTVPGFSEPVAVVENFNLAETLDLTDDVFSYIGFTAATGNCYEKHEIMKFDVCLKSDEQPVGVWEETVYTDNDILVIPNPANDEIRIDLQGIIGNNTSASIVDILANTIKNLTISGRTQTIDISDLPPGIYFLILNKEGELYKTRFIKMD